jgi:hypothetical protein
VVVNIYDGSGHSKSDFLACLEDGDQAVSAGNNICKLA